MRASAPPADGRGQTSGQWPQAAQQAQQLQQKKMRLKTVQQQRRWAALGPRQEWVEQLVGLV
jgi:hypothetical protein